MVRDIGVMQLHVVNDGAEVARFYTPSDKTVTHNGSPTMQDWHHVVLVVDQAKSEFWIDGQLSKAWNMPMEQVPAEHSFPMWRTPISWR